MRFGEFMTAPDPTIIPDPFVAIFAELGTNRSGQRRAGESLGTVRCRVSQSRTPTTQLPGHSLRQRPQGD